MLSIAFIIMIMMMVMVTMALMMMMMVIIIIIIMMIMFCNKISMKIVALYLAQNCPDHPGFRLIFYGTILFSGTLISRMLNTHISFIYRRLYVTLASDSVVKYSI